MPSLPSFLESFLHIFYFVFDTVLQNCQEKEHLRKLEYIKKDGKYDCLVIATRNLCQSIEDNRNVTDQKEFIILNRFQVGGLA
jgi:hypothetical protein